MSLCGNINAKKKRIKAGSGETMKPKGAKGRPRLVTLHKQLRQLRRG